MIALRIAVGLGVGLVFGAALVVVSSPTDRSMSSSELTQAAEARCPERVDVFGQAESLRERHRVAEGLVRGLRATEIELIGEPPAWPDALPPELRADQARATIERVFAGTPYRIDGIDCEEFPCLVAARWEIDAAELEGEGPRLSGEELDDHDIANYQVGMSYRALPDGRGGMSEWSALAPYGLLKDRVPDDRLHHRKRTLSALWRELAADVAEGGDENRD